MVTLDALRFPVKEFGTGPRSADDRFDLKNGLSVSQAAHCMLPQLVKEPAGSAKERMLDRLVFWSRRKENGGLPLRQKQQESSARGGYKEDSISNRKLDWERPPVND